MTRTWSLLRWPQRRTQNGMRRESNNSQQLLLWKQPNVVDYEGRTRISPLAKYSHVLMSFKMKERGIHARSLLFWSLFHTRAQILINLYDLTSPWINYLILQYMWHMCMLPFYLPWSPHNLSLEVGWKEAMLWWGYIHIERHERYYGEVKLWLVFAKYF